MARKHEPPRILLRREKDPSQLGAKNPEQLGGAVGNYLPPGAQYEFKPPSVFEQHRLLSIVFAGMVLIGLLYWVFATAHYRRHTEEAAVPAAAPPAPARPADEPVYVQPISPH